MVAEKGSVSVNSHPVNASQWDVWFGTNSTGVRAKTVVRKNRAFDATPDSVMNTKFAYVLPPGFSLLPAQGDSRANEQIVPYETTAENRALAAESSEGCTLVSLVCTPPDRLMLDDPQSLFAPIYSDYSWHVYATETIRTTCMVDGYMYTGM